ncbi:MAG: anaerobic carbon-monoxide dehydrogenase, complex subunit alpha, partial [Methanolobus sp.]|nr:anaerobic carbon-monoxide dehydrogenase, complex subunit alpha [Methanolobus sp.]
MEAHQARETLLRVITGAAAHAGHGRHILHHLIHLYGEDKPIEVGPSNLIAPNTQAVTGIKPETLGDLEEVMDYVEEQLTQLLATIHAGQEGAAIDFESKILHGGMLDHVGMEVSDLAQISCLGMPKSDPEAPLVEIGMGCIDSSKPVLVVIGHNVAGVTNIMDKVIGTLAKELKMIRSGVPDVIVVDEQCVRADVLDEAKKLSIPVITTNEKIMYGLRNRSNDSAADIIEDLSTFKEPGALILDFDVLGEVAPELAIKMSKIREEMGIKALPGDD